LFLGGAPQKFLDLVIRGLRKILVPETDGLERLWGKHADHLVYLGLKFLVGGGSGHGHGNDHARRSPQARGRHRGTHACPRRQPIVDQNDGTVAKLRRGSIATIKTLAAAEFPSLLGADRVDDFFGNSQALHNLLIQDAHATGRDSTHGELDLPWDAQFADQKNVEWRVQGQGYFITHRHAAAGQREYQDVWIAGIGREFPGQFPARVLAIMKAHGLSLRLSLQIIIASSVPLREEARRKQNQPGAPAMDGQSAAAAPG